MESDGLRHRVLRAGRVSMRRSPGTLAIRLVFAACGVVLVASFAAPARAAHDRGVRIDVGGHAGARLVPGARTQFWRVRAADRSSGAVIAITVWAAPEPRVQIEGRDPRLRYRHDAVILAKSAAARPGGVALTGADGAAARLERAGRGWRLEARAGTISASIRLARPAQGVRAGPWRLDRQRDGRRAHVRWATPAPLARAQVRVSTTAGTTAFGSGHGYLDHTWGSVDLEQRAWVHWDMAQVALGARRGFVLHGLDDSGEVSGPGSRDPVFRGVLVTVTPRGTSACRPAVRRRRWTYGIDYFEWALRARARCGGRSVTFDTPRRRDTFVGGEGGPDWVRFTSIAVRRGRPRGIGSFDHLVWTL